jgi:DNA-binding winged helix-turn-helix (wHTH) protein
MRYVFGDCTLDTEYYELHRAGVRIPVRPKVFQLLAYLIAHRDRVLMKDEMIAYLWPQQFVGDAALKSCLMTARKAVGDTARSQRIIQTRHGHGYRFVAVVTTGDQPAPTSATLPALSGASAPPATRAEIMPDHVSAVPHSTDHTLEQEHKQVTVLWVPWRTRPRLPPIWALK